MEYSLNSTHYNRTDDPNTYIHPAFIVFASIIFTIEIPFICFAIFVVFCLTKSCSGAPVFVINLLITDLIQIVSFFLLFAFYYQWAELVLVFVFYTGMYFMTCVAIERYLLIAHPVWYRSHRSVKRLVCTSLFGWVLHFITFSIDWNYQQHLWIILPFIYYIVIMFCCAGAWRSLFHSQLVTSLKRQLVLASLFFVLLGFTFTILPLFIIMVLMVVFKYSLNKLFLHAVVLNSLNPMVDCLLYVFLRNDVGNAIRTPSCCPRPRRIQSDIPLNNVTEEQSRGV